MRKGLLMVPAVVLALGMGAIATPRAAGALEGDCTADVNASNLAQKLNAGDVKLCNNITDISTEVKITSTHTLDLNGYKLQNTDNNSYGALTVGTNGNLTIEDSEGTGEISFTDGAAGQGNAKRAGAPAVMMEETGAQLTVKGGTLKGGSYGVSERNASSGAKITVQGGKITGKQAAVVLYNDTTLDVQDGLLEGEDYAVAGWGDDEDANTTIVIGGGTLRATGTNGTAAIYQPQNGEITMTGGLLEGQNGIVARQGKVHVRGGTIRATGTGTGQIGADPETQVELGVGILIDNQTAGYGGTATAEIGEGAQVEATNDNPVLAMGDATNLKVEPGATFNKPVDEAYLVDGAVQLEDGRVLSQEDYEAYLKEQEEAKAKTEDPENPDTADSIVLYVTVATMALIGLGATVLTAARKRNR